MTLRQHIDGTLVYDESMRLCYPPPWCGVDLPSAMYQKAVDILNDSDSGWNDRKFKRKQTQTKAIEKQGGGRVAGVESSVELYRQCHGLAAAVSISNPPDDSA